MVKVAVKPQESVFKPALYNLPNWPNIDAKNYMISLEKELENVLKSRPSTKGVKNMGTELTIILFMMYLLLIIFNFRRDHRPSSSTTHLGQ